MAWKDRIKLYKAIEAHRNSPLIVYVTSKRAGVVSSMANDALPSIIEQIDDLPANTTKLDLLIASYGGDPMVAWRIMNLIRQRDIKSVSVLIPQSAYSAATLLALGANEIVIHPNGHLGPVDMQIRTTGDGGPKSFSTEDISAFLDFVRDNLKITDQRHVRRLFEVVCAEVGTLGIGFTARSSKLAVDLGERLLAMHMEDEESRPKRRSIVENMSRLQFQSHAYPVSRTEAIGLDLPVKKERDQPLEKLMWDAWLHIENDLQEREPFDPIHELARSAEAAKLFGAVPQMDLPATAANVTASFSTTLDDVANHTKTHVAAVDFSHIGAVVESSRGASAHMIKGKILATRMPYMSIDYNLVTTSKLWEKVEAEPLAQGVRHG